MAQALLDLKNRMDSISSGWIHIKNQYPFTNEILVWDEVHKECCICYNQNGKWKSHYSSYQIDFKYWMNLPNPPCCDPIDKILCECNV
jgi:hypothetical protein